MPRERVLEHGITHRTYLDEFGIRFLDALFPTIAPGVTAADASLTMSYLLNGSFESGLTKLDDRIKSCRSWWRSS